MFKFIGIWNISLGGSHLSSVYILYSLLPHLTLYQFTTPSRCYMIRIRSKHTLFSLSTTMLLFHASFWVSSPVFHFIQFLRNTWCGDMPRLLDSCLICSVCHLEIDTRLGQPVSFSPPVPVPPWPSEAIPVKDLSYRT